MKLFKVDYVGCLDSKDHTTARRLFSSNQVLILLELSQVSVEYLECAIVLSIV